MTGFRSWSTGDTVSAADFVSYISTQCLTVFATATARDAAITSPSEGMFSYTITTPAETLSYYDGSSWVATSLTADITGITTAAASGLSGGATSGNVTLTLNLAGVTAAQAFGSDGSGVDVTFHSGTAGDYLLWDASEEKLIIEGTNGATALDVTDGNVVIGDGTLSVSGVITATGGVTGNVSGSSGSTTGNAATATALETARNIGGVSFNGTAAIVPGTITVADTTDTTCSVALFESATGDLAPKTDGGATYNAGTGTLTATAFAGPLTGNVTGDASGTAATVTGAAQTAITSVGTLSALDVTGALTAGSLVAPLAINAQTGTTYTFVLADAGKLVTSSNGSAQTITVPPNSSVAFAIGTQIIVQNIGSANATLATAGTPTLNSKDSNLEIDGQFAAATLIKTATDTWSLIGALA
jgi:hypothetical protein